MVLVLRVRVGLQGIDQLKEGGRLAVPLKAELLHKRLKARDENGKANLVQDFLNLRNREDVSHCAFATALHVVEYGRPSAVDLVCNVHHLEGSQLWNSTEECAGLTESTQTLM